MKYSYIPELSDISQMSMEQTATLPSAEIYSLDIISVAKNDPSSKQPGKQKQA